jgi:hypothetical protein
MSGWYYLLQMNLKYALKTKLDTKEQDQQKQACWIGCV